MENTTQTVEVEKEIQGKTVLSFTHPTPQWAIYIFRTEFIINKALLMILGGTSLLQPSQIKEALLWVGIIDFVTWFFARSIGIKKDQFESDEQK